MKATPSKDGKMRFTVRIPFRIGLEGLIEGLGWTLRRDADLDTTDNKAMAIESALKKFKSRKAIIDAAICSIKHEGDAVWTWSDDCPYSNEIIEQARVLVLKKFPELKTSI